MPEQSHLDDLRLAHMMADNADSLTMSRFKALDLKVEAKPDLTPVSDADVAVEDAIRRALKTARPRDAVHGEERGDTGWGPRRWVIDTPGVRSFGLSHVTRESIVAAFPDLRALTEGCPRGCTHGSGEPECALDQAVADGRLATERLQSLRRMEGAWLQRPAGG